MMTMIGSARTLSPQQAVRDAVVIDALACALADGVPVDVELQQLAPALPNDDVKAATARATAGAAHGDLALALADLRRVGIDADLARSMVACPRAARALRRAAAATATAPALGARLRRLRWLLFIALVSLVFAGIAAALLSLFVAPVLQQIRPDDDVRGLAGIIESEGLGFAKLAAALGALGALALLVTPGLLTNPLRPLVERARQLRLARVLVEHGVAPASALAAAGVAVVVGAPTALSIDAVVADLERRVERRVDFMTRVVHVVAVAIVVVVAAAVLVASYGPISRLGSAP